LRYLYLNLNIITAACFAGKLKIMQKFQLELFFHIIGIGSASGLFFNGKSLFIISDNSNVLYEYHTENKKLDKIPLANDTRRLENIPKPDKPDFEAIAEKNGDLYLFGSGSIDRRKMYAVVKMDTKEVLGFGGPDLHNTMRLFGEIDSDNFNIEAAVNDGETWYFFNRGNGPKGQNVIFTLTGNINELEFQMIYNDIEIPKINGAQSSFTDAVKAGDKLYFLAAAEKSNSTYHDGEVAGTLIGRIDIETMEVEMTEIISIKNKFEGLTIYKEDDKSIQFLLCEDTDADSEGSDIYKLTIKK
jgi:hypothetical protein